MSFEGEVMTDLARLVQDKDVENEELRAINADLLEACKRAELWFTMPRTEIEHDVHTLNTLRAAIAKATDWQEPSVCRNPDEIYR